MDVNTNYVKVRRVLLVILVLNFTVSFAKIIYGIISKSSSITADGYHSFSDGTSNIVGILGIWMASRPPDESHHYGHHKFETLATSFIGFLLFLVSFKILWDAYSRFRNPITPNINTISFIVMGLTLIINFFVARYEYKKGKELNSSILIADSNNTKSDIYVTISVIVGLLAIKFNFIIIDTIIAVIIAGLIIKAALEIILPSIKVLTDAYMINRTDIYDFIINQPGVIYCHKIKTRGTENYILVDFHLGLDKTISLDMAHKVSHDIKENILKEFDDIHDVVIHIEPAE